MYRYWIAALAIVFAGVSFGCDPRSPGEKIEDGVEDVGEGIRDGFEDAGDEIEDAFD